MNLNNKKSKLPFIIFPENNLKILVDTGSTKSFVNPVIANKFYKKSIKPDPFQISSAHGSSFGNFSVAIPCPEIFKNDNLILDFHLFKFHNNFDCLIGLDNLQKLNAIIDLGQNLFITPHASIKILFYDGTNSLNTYTINPLTEQVIEICIDNIENGEIIIPHMKLKNFEIPECITLVKNNIALCTVINNTDETRELQLTKPVKVENFSNYIQENPNNQNFYQLHNLDSFDITKIRTNHMNLEEKYTISNLAKQYADIFYVEGQNLTFTNHVKHHIRTSDEIPVYTKSYRYPEIHKQEVRKQISKMLDQNIIRPSHSPWSSPLWVVPKKLDASGERKWRIVIDYRKLNQKTIGDRYPLPNISDLLDKLGRCQYFTTLDLASGFHQIEMAKEDIPKTAFNTENGHYEFSRMPFGLKNAPSTFQRVMDNILQGIQNEKCLVYLDDIIIFSVSLQEHVENLKSVFDRLRKYNFKIQLDKSEFLQREVAFLGHIITPEGVRPNPDKIHAIKNYPLPKSETEIKQFLGLLGYYRKFIRDFAKITKPFTKCLKKDAIVNYKDPEYVKCFEFCKTLLTNEPILQYPDFTKPFILTTDASNFAIGAVLSQGKVGSDLPIAYASRTLNTSETNYSTIEKELLAIVWAVTHFRPYLFGRKFIIYTDHRPLQWLFSIKEPNSKFTRWKVKLSEYDFEIIYKQGSVNKNADALSRIEINLNETIEENHGIYQYMKNFNKNFDTSIPGPSKENNDVKSLDSSTDNDSVILIEDDDSNSLIVNLDNDENELINHPENLNANQNLDNNDDSDQTVHSNISNPIIEIPIVECPVNYGKNQVIISEVNYDPAMPTIIKLFENKQRFLVQLSKNNTVKDILHFVKTYIVPKVKYHIYFEDPLYETFSTTVKKYFKNSELNLIKCTTKLVDVCEEDEIVQTIKSYHESKTNHRGLDETHAKIKNLYYWPNQRRSIQTYINNCEICQITKYDRKPLNLKLNITPTAIKPFQILHIDTVSLDKTKFLTIIDSFSKYAQAYKLNSCQAIEIVNNLVKYFTHHCIPKQIISDNGLEFKNSVVTELLNVHKINIHFISSQHPESNGMIERFHSTLIEHIRLLNNQNEYKTENIENKVNYALLAYNNSIHSVTKLRPYEIVTGHLETESPFDIDIDTQLMNNYISNHKDKMKILYGKINSNIQENKTKTIEKINLTKNELPETIPKNVFVKNKQKQSKTKNKFKIQKIETISPKLKTAKIIPSHKNVSSKIHLSNIKNPRKQTYKFKKITDSSQSEQEQK